MAALRHHESLLQYQRRLCAPSPKPHLRLNRNFVFRLKNLQFSRKIRILRWGPGGRDGLCSACCLCKTNSKIESVEAWEEIERPPFDINLAVILAGFAFEAYSSPPENVGKREVDAADCKTVYLSGSFLREIYDGQLFIKLKKGFDFPAMDPWGTSDPYVALQLDGQVVKSKVKWGTKEPTWNEELTFNVKLSPSKSLQVAAWDANLVTPHKRMGNSNINLECLCNGNLQEVLVELEGMGGGGKIQLEVQYKSFDEIDEEKQWWRVPFISEFFQKNGFQSALKMIVGSETVQARQFVQYAFGQLKSFNNAYLQKESFSYGEQYEKGCVGMSSSSIFVSDMPSQVQASQEGFSDDTSCKEDGSTLELHTGDRETDYGHSSSSMTQVGETLHSDEHFWKNFADVINKNVIQKFGISFTEKIKWDGFDLLNRIGLQSRRIAEAGYVESGLAISDSTGVDDSNIATTAPVNISTIQSSLPGIKKATQDILRQTDSVLGALMVLTTAVSKLNKDAHLLGKGKLKQDTTVKMKDDVSRYFEIESFAKLPDESILSDQKAEELRALFSTAESAVEAWAMLATSLGHPSFIKSEFEKICFLDNTTTDTQVAIWRDSARKRLVVAFRGTEQARWKDLQTDLMLVPAGDNGVELLPEWHVYVTGHSLGGALATLLALELSSSQLAKHGAISVTMYNFGSPRVGNKRFAELYNEKVKDSWRVVNHRDIIPTVPRLMGYCHIAQPVYLAAGNLTDALENIELLGDGYQGDVIGESTPDVLVSEFMKGEKELVEKLLHTEINIFRSIRDGSALMQHMEDFYYIALLESVRLNYQTVARSQTNEEASISVS
ncbi:uncharacterized protein LOC131151613 isoform X2 [Malania oleifera]|uniref:uncharacterized protein LOC131151613 isoform X2 n=1 Tax=Malania oleifera TaxID=397392 RepID=UPI0025AE85A6|nr:uncharacterized protein LOC131151613 isoform X2 [Malania oleifera]